MVIFSNVLLKLCIISRIGRRKIKLPKSSNLRSLECIKLKGNQLLKKYDEEL